MGIFKDTIGTFSSTGAKYQRLAMGAQREIAAIEAIQRRRSFIRSAREAMAGAQTAQVASGAGLESSAALGNQASLQTQMNVGLADARRVEDRQFYISKMNQRILDIQERNARRAGLGSIADTALGIWANG